MTMQPVYDRFSPARCSCGRITTNDLGTGIVNIDNIYIFIYKMIWWHIGRGVVQRRWLCVCKQDMYTIIKKSMCKKKDDKQPVLCCVLSHQVKLHNGLTKYIYIFEWDFRGNFQNNNMTAGCKSLVLWTFLLENMKTNIS